MDNKYTTRALKAWETRRRNKNKINKKVDYNRDNKNSFRDKVIESFSMVKDEDNEYCLLLESPQFLFVNNCNKKFIIVEKSKKSYIEMVNNLPFRVTYIYNNDLSVIRNLSHKFSCAFLDFCSTFNSSEKLLKYILPSLIGCDKIAFTFCLRRNIKSIPDYKFDLIKKLLNIFKNFEIDYAESYKDGAPMVGIILKNSDKNVQDIYLSEIRERCRVMFKDKFGYGIYDYPQNVVNPRAPINRVRDFSKVKWLFDNMPNKYIDQLRHYSMYIKYLENDYTSSLYGKSLTLLDFFIDYVL